MSGDALFTEGMYLRIQLVSGEKLPVAKCQDGWGKWNDDIFLYFYSGRNLSGRFVDQKPNRGRQDGCRRKCTGQGAGGKSPQDPGGRSYFAAQIPQPGRHVESGAVAAWGGDCPVRGPYGPDGGGFSMQSGAEGEPDAAHGPGIPFGRGFWQYL